MNTEINDWSNYATWRVYEDLFSDLNIVDDIDDGYNLLDDGKLPSVEKIMKWANAYAHSAVFKSVDYAGGGVAERWALYFLRDVDWTAIATYLIEDARE